MSSEDYCGGRSIEQKQSLTPQEVELLRALASARRVGLPMMPGPESWEDMKRLERLRLVDPQEAAAEGLEVPLVTYVLNETGTRLCVALFGPDAPSAADEEIFSEDAPEVTESVCELCL